MCLPYSALRLCIPSTIPSTLSHLVLPYILATLRCGYNFGTFVSPLPSPFLYEPKVRSPPRVLFRNCLLRPRQWVFSLWIFCGLVVVIVRTLSSNTLCLENLWVSLSLRFSFLNIVFPICTGSGSCLSMLAASILFSFWLCPFLYLWVHLGLKRIDFLLIIVFIIECNVI